MLHHTEINSLSNRTSFTDEDREFEEFVKTVAHNLDIQPDENNPKFEELVMALNMATAFDLSTNFGDS